MLLRFVPAAALTSAFLLLVLLSGPARPTQSAPDFSGPAGQIVPGNYIVVLEPGVSPKEATHRLQLHPRAYYRSALNGLDVEMSEERAAEIAADPSVSSVEPVRLMGIGLHENPFQTLVEGIDRIDADENSSIDLGGPPGPNVDARIAVIDTGIDVDHEDLNVVGGFGAYQQRTDDGSGSPSYGGCNTGHAFDDEHGHGTHVAGTAAAVDNSIGVAGVAPGAALYAVRVLRDDGFGCDSDVIRGIDWVTERKAEFNNGAADGDPGIDINVVNMSLGGLPSGALCSAIANSVAQNIMYAVAAGNNTADASNSGPANCATAVTVSAYADYDGKSGGLADPVCSWTQAAQSDPDDTFAWFSNYGSMVEIAAPGVCIMSTYPGDGIGLYGTMSGTSMATPHVAGAMALLHALTGFSGPYDTLSVMEAFHTLGWTRPSNSPCGFGDDPDDHREPILYLGSSCPTASYTPPASPTPSPSPAASPTPTPTPTSSPSPPETPTPTGTADPASGDPADIDCSKTVTGIDSILLLRFAAQLATTLLPGCPPIGALVASEGGTQSLRGDLNCDGVVNHADALRVLQRVADLPGTLNKPCAN
ncbi:MAG TPA: S8 family serine peptidase [Dehalococcoidia bacterium]|nr:S8 family serine peptidase [Dehalococcoidia bacterium]